MDLKPQRNHTFSLSSNFRIGKYDAYYIGMELSHVYSNRLILDYSFLDGNILNKTKANIGCKHQTKLQISARKELPINAFFPEYSFITERRLVFWGF